jgi:hypothetical protein
MPKTCVQTVEVFAPGWKDRTEGEDHTFKKVRGIWLPRPDSVLEQCPVRPANTKKTVAVQTKDSLIIWFPTGKCEVHMADGTEKVFWPKPTLAEVVKAPGYGQFLRFYADGAVEEKYDGVTYHWSADVEAEPLKDARIVTPAVYWCQGPKNLLVGSGAYAQSFPWPKAVFKPFPDVRAEIDIFGDWNLMMRECACGPGCYARNDYLTAEYGRDEPPPSCETANGVCGDCRECLGDYDTSYESDDSMRPGWQRPRGYCAADD